MKNIKNYLNIFNQLCRILIKILTRKVKKYYKSELKRRHYSNEQHKFKWHDVFIYDLVIGILFIGMVLLSINAF